MTHGTLASLGGASEPDRHGRVWLPIGRGILLVGLVLLAWTALQPEHIVIAPGWFLPLHALTEMSAVVVASLIFFAVWHQRKTVSSGALLAGFGFLSIAMFDIAHLLSHEGMPDFVTPNSPHKAIVLWLAGRFVMLGVIVALVFAPDQRIPAGMAWKGLVVTITTTLALIVAIVVQPEHVPATIVPGAGLPPLKAGLEFFLVAGFGFMLMVLVGRRAHTSWSGELLMLAIVATLISGLFFTLYSNAGNLGTLLGQLYKVVAYGALYRMTFLENVRVPYFELATARQQLAEEERFLNGLITQAPDGVLVVDEEGRIEVANRQIEQDFGYAEAELRGQPVEMLVPDGLRDAHSRHRAEFLRKPRVRPMGTGGILHGRTRHGQTVAIEASLGLATLNGQRKVLAFVRNVSDRKRLEAERSGLLDVLKESPDWIVQADQDLVLTYANPAAIDAFGLQANHGGLERTQRVTSLFNPADCVTPPEAMFETAERLGVYSGESSVLAREGQSVPVSIVVIAHRLSANSATRYSLVARDLSERVGWERQLAHHATHDRLTGLPNRLVLIDRIEQSITLARRERELAAVMFIDLDNFKLVNDNLGHSAGDELLVGAALRLQDALRQGDTLARFGGDEFVVVISGLSAPEAVRGVAGKLLHALEEPFSVGATRVTVNASIGICLVPLHADTAEAALSRADQAMYRAKNEGRGIFQVFSPDIDMPSADDVALLAALREAVRRPAQLCLHYQPHVAIPNGEILGVEALLRWSHPQLGHVSPARFIPLAEENGLIEALGDWVLETACQQIARWKQAGISIRVAVNVSAQQLRQPAFAAKVRAILLHHGIEPHLLELEVTESALMRCVDIALENLTELSTLGVQIALDDFGTGYSSLAHLKNLPLNKLKIDRSFVQNINKKTGDAAIVQALIGLARQLELRVVAEGVETARELAVLVQLGCVQAQGWLFHHAMPAEECGEILLTRSPGSGAG